MSAPRTPSHPPYTLDSTTPPAHPDALPVLPGQALTPGTPMPKPGEVFPTELPLLDEGSNSSHKSSTSSGVSTRALLVGASAAVALCSAVALFAYRYGITSTQRRASSKQRQRDAHLRKVQRLEGVVHGLYTLKSLKSIYSSAIEGAAREGAAKGAAKAAAKRALGDANALRQEEGNARHQELLKRIKVRDADTVHASIDRRGFVSLLEVIGVNSRNASNIFNLWDDQGDGRVDFLALVHFLAIMSASATRREKLEFIFEVLDVEHKGLLTVSQVVECVLRQCVACNILKSRPRVTAHVHTLLPRRTRGGTGVASSASPEKKEASLGVGVGGGTEYEQQIEIADFMEMASLSDFELDSPDSRETRGNAFMVTHKFGS